MRISFDLDDTLICSDPSTPREKAGILTRMFFREALRKGTIDLIHQLRGSGHSVWLYTSSFRSEMYLKCFSRLYGIRIDGVVNQERHNAALVHFPAGRDCSKYPPAFAIDLHIDDSIGVCMEGERRGFKVLVVNKNDSDWCQHVLKAVS